MERTRRLAAPQRRALGRLASIPVMRSFQLAGGAGLAVHLGHRHSADLDFFSQVGETNLENVALASIADIAAMKLAAVARRGIRRDFWDLHAIAAAGLPLSDAFAAYRKKFGKSEGDTYHVLRALTYFDDAEAETLWPMGLTPRRWNTIKAFFRREAPRLLLTAQPGGPTRR